MKKYLFLFVAAVLSFASAFAQEKTNVARECVLFEIFTGVRCPYCPAAANGIAQLLEEGKAIAPVAYHTDAFSTAEYFTAETNARASYYGVNSYPTLKADGILSKSGGGGASETMYSSYLNYYNQRISQTSPFTIDLSVEPDGDKCRVNCVVEKVGDCAGTDVRVFIALTQCNLDVSWQGMQGLHHVCRDMIPTQTGTIFTGTSMTISETFEMNYPKEDCYLTAWVQNYSGGTKEVYQAVRLSTALDVDYDLVVKGISQVVTKNCSGKLSPVLQVKNCGNATVNTFDIVASVNGQEVNRYTWNGTLNHLEMADVEMPEFDFGSADKLTFNVVMPNGHEDDFSADNSISVDIEGVSTIDGYLKIRAKSGAHYESESIVITDMTTGEVFDTFTFDKPSHSYTFEVVLPNASCYRISAIDTEGLGWGNGFFQVTDANNQAVMQGGGSSNHIDYELSSEVYCDGELNVDEVPEKELEIYPNPNNGIFSLDLCEGQWQVSVYDAIGHRVYENAQFTEGQIDLRQYGNGVYFVKAKNGSDELVKKVVVL
ncbi:MAG: T9SS type A sorting domain-containing protein [Bacteroidales bacterium]|nr:T9SS type A sorting domain-containing protein [Bacteroidales bacterium]